MLNEEIYEPFLISNHTIISFEYCKQNQKLVSIKEIIQEFSKLAQTQAKYFFTFKSRQGYQNNVDELLYDPKSPLNNSRLKYDEIQMSPCSNDRNQVV